MMRPFDYQPYRPSWRRSPVWSRIKPWLLDGLVIVATVVTGGTLTLWMFR